MAKKKGKRTVSSSSKNPNADVPAAAAQTEVTISNSNLTVKEAGCSFESEDKYNNTSNEVLHEETAVSCVKNENFAKGKQKFEDAAITEEEWHEDKSIDVGQKSNKVGQKNDEQNEIKGVDKAEEEEEQEEDEGEEENEENTIGKSNNREKVRAGSTEKVKRLRQPKNKAAHRGSEIKATRAEGKLGSRSNKKASKRVESMGMVFMCNSKTKKDCYHYKVLGLPESKKEIVQKVYKGMRLFLFDVDLRLMYGIYKAKGPGGYNLEPKAFKSAFPAQVRFKVLEDCLPLAEEKFKRVIKDNYYTRNKFNCQLTSQQVKNLCKLFTASTGSKHKESSSNIRAETHSFMDWDQNLDIERHPTLVADRQYHDQPIIYEMDPAASAAVLAEPHGYVDRDRIRLVDEGRHYSLVANPLYHDLPPTYESPVAPRSRLSPLPSADVYSYTRDQRLEGLDSGLLDLELRRQDEIRSRDLYVSYQEPLYQNTLYSSGGVPQEHAPGLRTEYRSPAVPREYDSPGLRAEYRYPAGLQREYDPPGLRAEYRHSGITREHHHSPGLRAEYRHHHNGAAPSGYVVYRY